MDKLIHYLYDPHSQWITVIERRIDWISLALFLSYFFVRISLLDEFKLYSAITWIYIAVFIAIGLFSYVIHRTIIPCQKTIILNLSYAAVSLVWLLSMYWSA